MTIFGWDPGMLRHQAVGRSLALLVCFAPASAAQSPGDSAKQHENGSIRAWASLGLGPGNSYVGGPAARAAASVAVNGVVVLTLEETGMGSPFADRTVASTNVLVGIKTPDPQRFIFLSAGPGMTKCGNGCPGQSGIAVDAGWHIGARHAGVALVGFAVFASGRNRCSCNSSNVNTTASGVVVSMDLGWFVH